MNSLGCMSCSLGTNENKGVAGVSKMADDFRYSTAGTIPGGVGTGVLPLKITTHSDSYFVIQKLIAVNAFEFTCQIQETGSGILLSDSPIYNVNMWGTAQRPAILIDPLVLAPSSDIKFALVNQNAGANAVQLILEGYKHYDLKNPPVMKSQSLLKPFQGSIKWFDYSADVSLAANAFTSIPIKIQSDSNFILRKYIGKSTGNFSLRLSDTASGSQWSDNLIQRDNFLGTAQYPAILHKSRWVRKNSTIQVELQDLSGAPNTIQVVLEGAKQYV